MLRVPFTLPDVGLDEVKGFVYLENGYLVLSLQKVTLGMVEQEPEIFKIEPGALHDVSVKHGLFRDKLVVAPKTMELLDAVPGDHRAAVELRVKRKYRADLEKLEAAFWHLADAPPA